ncbi:HlyD family type I secretion periplasmic adaptor subunit [uncultured Victivallis sp.]|uniref:HlyD family type I secretion periplasmic adaptor subunit n=1 Tax=uncultured Victivallis sp. TaxID=354118 RepID=UPI0025CFD5FF|nr:HlyD family type I secretion periplasmic adaptor subunit [uncultured Victivallis sp.]
MSENEKLCRKAIEFQPDALEIKHERLPWWARYGIWSAFLFMAGAVVWATFGKVDMVVTAEGKLVTDSPNIVMKPLERTVIKSINVKVGEVVKKDQILFTFDPVMNVAEAERLASELSTLGAQVDRLLAEFKHLKYEVSDPQNEDQVWQKAIYDQRQKFYEEKIRYYDQSIKQIQASQHTTSESLAKQEEQLEAIKRIELMFTELQEKNTVSLKETLEIQIQRMELEASVINLRNTLVEQQHQEQTAIASKNSYIEEWRNSISTELVSVQRELTSTQKQYDKSQAQLTYDVLRAPCNAMVHEIASFPVGSAVREAEALITLVPLDSEIELEAEVRPQDIGRVHIGSEVRVKLNSFPFQKHGTLDGVVRTISEDSFEKQQGEPGSARTYYRTRITLSGHLRNVKDDFRLIPGMECQAEIKVGERRIIEYLIHPLIKSLDESMREP